MANEDPDEQDRTLFRTSVKDVRRLRQRGSPPPRTRLPPTPRPRARDEPRLPEEPRVRESVAETEIGDSLAFARPGLQHGVMRRLRRGQFPLEATLDLHGMTAALARRELDAFLARSLAADARCVLVIHGKGRSAPDRTPVLKSGVNTWLRRPEVLAFCSARPGDGGTGALYVLLRKPR